MGELRVNSRKHLPRPYLYYLSLWLSRYHCSLFVMSYSNFLLFVVNCWVRDMHSGSANSRQPVTIFHRSCIEGQFYICFMIRCYKIGYADSDRSYQIIQQLITNEYVKDHIFELRRKIWIYDWSSQLHIQLLKAVVKLKPEKNSRTSTSTKLITTNDETLQNFRAIRNGGTFSNNYHHQAWSLCQDQPS